jgi:serine/threonine protein kinase/formylglycine-generating enzyme required for sulfatase activity
MSEEYRNALAEGFTIDTYRIERVLGAGGFGITYLVSELNLGKLFAMKELLPDGIAIRRTGDTSHVEAKSQSSEGDFQATRKYFISEARILAGMDHPAVVSVHRLMEANGTCYMVMDYIEGDTLGDYLKKRGGRFSGLDEFQQIFYPLMSGLDVLHAQGIIHRDIKPGNIMVRPDGSPVLLDFGAATQTQSQTMTITQMLSAGYSPFEQYTSRAKQGPYTDIYALGATMLKCITGKKPDDASDRVYGDRYQSLAEDEAYTSVYGMPLLAAIDEALKMEAELRPQTVDAWRRMMERTGKKPEVAMVSGLQPRRATTGAVKDEGDARPEKVHIGSQKQADAEYRLTRSWVKHNFAFLMWLMERKWCFKSPKKTLKAWGGVCVMLLIFCVVMSIVLRNRQDTAGQSRSLKTDGKTGDRASVVGMKAGDLKEVTIAGQLVKFRWCPATGEEGFMMGSPIGETDRSSNEGKKGQHKVVLTKGFWLMEAEVTQGLWEVLMGTTPAQQKAKGTATGLGEDHPMYFVSWEDCKGFIDKLNGSGKLPKDVKAAMPTEAQWEYACRAGSSTYKVFHYGNSLGSSQANFNGDYPYGGAAKGVDKKSTVAVKSYEANAWGLYDMHGNVYEWCADWYDEGYYGTAAAGKDPQGPGEQGWYRVLRSRNEPGIRDYRLGFRLSLQVEAR